MKSYLPWLAFAVIFFLIGCIFLYNSLSLDSAIILDDNIYTELAEAHNLPLGAVSKNTYTLGVYGSIGLIITGLAMLLLAYQARKL